uniref:Desmoplakin b n=1 Tax=Labrus bergylta TaxID=56723 RepID=A0A3Q3NH30_9LABR
MHYYYVFIDQIHFHRAPQKVICKHDEAILKDNSQRSKWNVTGPGGLDMTVPSVCLLVPPPNPISISLANKNEQYYDAIMSIWNQLYINIKSLVAWQYCLLDLKRINSLTISMLAKMRPEEYRQLIKSLEIHFEEFKLSSVGSQMFGDEDKRTIESQFNGAQNHYEQLVVQLPTYSHSFPTAVSICCSRSLSELHALRLRLDGAEDTLSQHVHICLGDDGVHDCGIKISQLEVDTKSPRGSEFLRLRERIVKELEGMTDADKAQFLCSEIGIIDQRLASLDSKTHFSNAEDIVKVYEARLTEKETTSLTPIEVEEYMSALMKMKSDLDQKKDILASMEAELAKASHWNGQVGAPFHRCDIMLSKYNEQVSQLSDRWRRIVGQIDTRVQDLQSYEPQLQRYKQTSSSLSDWIDTTKRRQDSLQTPDLFYYCLLKALNSDIKSKRGTVDIVLRDNEACVTSIKDYESDLNSYTSGLETLLNIPIKRTMLKSPSMDLNQEATQLQTRYMELFTQSADYYRYLGELLKNMEELKMRNTRIDLLEEELRLLREDMHDRNSKNKSLEDALARAQLELNMSKDQLQSMEEVKVTTARQVNATRESLDSTQSQLADLNDQVTRLKYLLEEEKRKKRLAEERYTHQQEEYELVLSRRQKELETVSWSKVDLEKSVANKEQEIEQLRRQLADEASRVKELQKEISKVRSQCSMEINNLKLNFESQIQVSRTDVQRLAAQKDEDTTELRLQYDRTVAERNDLEEELRRLRLSLNQAEEKRKWAEEETQSQRAVITEEGRRRRELESKVDGLMRQRDEQSSQYEEELADVLKRLQDKSEELVYITHSLEEETRRRKTIEEGQDVLEQTLSQLQSKLSSSSMTTAQLRECKDELEKLRLELERESKERSRVEQNMSRLQGRMKDLQAMRDGLESQVENLRVANQEEIARRKQIETELDKTTTTMTEYNRTINTLRQSQENASMSGKRVEEERLRLQGELEESLRQNKTSEEQTKRLSTELKALQQQLLQEQARVKEANFKNESLYKTIEERNMALNESTSEVQRLKDMTESQTRERLRLEEELRTTRQEKVELLKTKQGHNDELSSQITALQLQLQASEHSNVDYRNLVSELSSEREKLMLEAEKIQKQATESIQSKYNDIVIERDDLLRRLRLSDNDRSSLQRLEDELNRLKLSLESELRNKQRLQDENDRLKRDVSNWKVQFESKQEVIKQYETDKNRLEREKNSLNSEIERLMRQLRELEEMYKSKLSAIQKELNDMAVLRQNMEAELRKSRETPALDASGVIFDGVRKKVTADQLLDCGVLDNLTFSQLAKGHKTVPEVSADKKINLKGTGPIAGVIVEGQKGSGSANGLLFKMTFAEAKKENLLPPDSIDLLLDAQAATGHIIDPRTNQKFTVEEACDQGLVDEKDKARLLAAEAAAVGFKDPRTGKPLSVFEAMTKGLIDQKTGLRLLQAQESAGGILDPTLSVFLPRDMAIKRNILDEDLCRALNKKPECYLDPDTQQGTTYIALKKTCKVDPSTGLLLLPEPKKPVTVQGLRDQVSVMDLVDANLLKRSDMDKLREGRLTSRDIEDRLGSYLRGSTCIAGIYDEANEKVLTIYQAMKDGLLKPGTTLELLEAQAASGFIVDPVNNHFLSVSDAYSKRLFGPEYKDSLLSAERAVTGYQVPGTDKVISLFQAIERGLVEKGHGIRLLEAQIASGGIIDPEHSHRIDVDVAYEKGYFDERMNRVLSSPNAETKGFFDPNTEENLTYKELKKACIRDKKTGLILLPIIDKSKLESTTRKRRVIIVDPETNKEMTVREAFDKGLIDYDTFIDLSEQECEWEEITITAPDGSTQFKLVDNKTGREYDITELLEKRVISQSDLDQYKSRIITLTQFADIITKKTRGLSRPSGSSSVTFSSSSSSSRTSATPKRSSKSSIISRDMPDCGKSLSSVSVTLSSPVVTIGEQEPVGAVFDTENFEKISIFEALNRGLVDTITAQRLLEAQACTGGIINPKNGNRLGIQEASRLGIIDENMASKLKPAQKAYVGFEDVKTRKKMSAAEAIKEKWLPYEAGHRFLEFQYITGGFHDPETGCKRTIQDALQMGWLDERTAQKLQDVKKQTKNLTCPKSKLKISYTDALDSCMSEERTGVRMLPASSVSSSGISSPYNVSSAPGSNTGSRSGSQRGSRRGSLDLGSPAATTSRYTFSSFTSSK